MTELNLVSTPMERCPHFEGCEAPICPLVENWNSLVWYCDEAICANKQFRELPWIETQKRISKIGARKDRYFTGAMLENIQQVRKGIQGIDPDLPLEQARKKENAWRAEKSAMSYSCRKKKVARVTRATDPVLSDMTKSSHEHQLSLIHEEYHHA